MPYTAFLDFMSSIEFKQDFMDPVKKEYEHRGNKIDNDDNESAIAAILAKAVEREAEVTKQREAAKEEYLNTLLEARIAHGLQGISPRCFSTLSTTSTFNNNNNNWESKTVTGTQANNNNNDDNDEVEEANNGGDDDNDDDPEEIVVSRKRSPKRNPSPNPSKSAKRSTWLHRNDDSTTTTTRTLRPLFI